MPYSPPRHKAKQEKRRKQAFDAQRGTAKQRGYDSDWRMLRNDFIKENPLCIFCGEEGKIVPAEVVDHIKTISEHPELRLVRSNLRSLCKEHHDRRTAKEQGFAKSRK